MKKPLLIILLLITQLAFAEDDSYLIDDSLAMARQGEFVRAKDLIEDLAINGNPEALWRKHRTSKVKEI